MTSTQAVYGKHAKKIIYRGHTIEGPDDALGCYHIHGPSLNGGCGDLASAKRSIRQAEVECANCLHKMHKGRGCVDERPFRRGWPPTSGEWEPCNCRDYVSRKEKAATIGAKPDASAAETNSL